MSTTAFEAIQPGLYRLGDAMTVLALTPEHFLVAVAADHEVGPAQALLGSMFEKENFKFLVFSTHGKTEALPLSSVDELMTLVADIVHEWLSNTTLPIGKVSVADAEPSPISNDAVFGPDTQPQVPARKSYKRG